MNFINAQKMISKKPSKTKTLCCKLTVIGELGSLKHTLHAHTEGATVNIALIIRIELNVFMIKF